jgi:DNA-binding transcriptional LysR family regulator
MEEQLGTELLERTYRGVKLTAAGERFLTHAKDILRHVDVALEDVCEAISVPTGRVALGLPQSMAKYLGVPLVREVLQRWPKIQLQIIEMNTGYVPDHLLKGDIDLGMTFGAEDGAGISYTHLLDEELVFVSSPAQMAALHRGKKTRGNTIRVSDLCAFPIILPTTTHSLRRRIDACLQEAKVRLDVVAEVNAIPQLIELAAAGVGSTVLSYASVFRDPSWRKLTVSKIIDPSITRSVYLCRSGTTPRSIAMSMTQRLIESLVEGMVSTGEWPTTVKP